MRVIPPVDLFSSSRVTSSTISEPDTGAGEAAWNSGTTYALGAEAISTTTHRIYESLQAGNLNHAFPDYSAGETQNAWWLDVGPTNKFAMFDYNRNTKSSRDTSITVVVTPGQRISALALLGLEANSITVTGTSGGDTVYGPMTQTVRSRDTSTWSEYFFGQFNAVPSVIFFDIPPYSDLVLTVLIENSGSPAKCGALVVGTATFIGDIEFNPVSDTLNFSTVERDIFGEATLIQRRSVPKTTQRVFADSNLVNTIRNLRTTLNAQVAVWSGLDDIDTDYGEALLIFGFYRSWSIDLTAPDVVEQNIEIEEF